MIRIGRGSGKWNMIMEELINSEFIAFRTSSISKMNAIIEEFGNSHEILDVKCHIRKDYVEVEVIYNN